MEKLKALIKEGLARKATCIQIDSQNGVRVALQDQGSSLVPGTSFQKLEDNWILKMLVALFPQVQTDLDQGLPIKAPLQISGVGTLTLVGKKTEQMRLFCIFFPPNPEAEAEKFIESLKPQAVEKIESFDFNLSLPDSGSLDLGSTSSTPVANVSNFSADQLFQFSSVPEPQKEETKEKPKEPETGFDPFSFSYSPESALTPPEPKKVETDQSFALSFDGSSSAVSSFDSPQPPPPPPSAEIYTPTSIGVGTPIEKITRITREGNDSSPKKIDPILKIMIQKKASDLHMTVGQPMIFRLDGDITRQTDTPILTEQMMKEYIYPIISETKLQIFEKTNDIDFAYSIQGVGRFRVNVFQDFQGMGAVLRHIPSEILSADQLGLPDVIRRFCKLPKGLLLVTGPTGSGKSTTLAAMIDLINSERSEHILTIEDPIEFLHPQKKCLINQREVGKHTASFSSALKAALREDPDIVLVGELRDLETTEMALETAETGHLVLATLHTNTAISTIDRIVDQFSPDEQRVVRNMLASSLKGVVAQTLCKKIGGGRCASYEILVQNDAVSAMIRESKIHLLASHMQTSFNEGNVLMSESLLNLVVQGKVTYEEAWKKAIDKKEFQEGAKRKNIQIPKG